MKAFGWAVAFIATASVATVVISVLSGWDADTVYGFLLGGIVCYLCEKVWGE